MLIFKYLRSLHINFFVFRSDFDDYLHAISWYKQKSELQKSRILRTMQKPDFNLEHHRLFTDAKSPVPRCVGNTDNDQKKH